MGYKELGASFICTVCHTGFTLRNSPRVEFANMMYQRERRAARPNDAEHRNFVATKPLTERSVFELQRIAGVIKSKQPSSADARERNAASLKAVEGELARRGHNQHGLSYRIGDVYPPGSIPLIKHQSG